MDSGDYQFTSVASLQTAKQPWIDQTLLQLSASRSARDRPRGFSVLSLSSKTA
jgi:hypothetical protein